MSSKAVICVECGFDVRTGKKVALAAVSEKGSQKTVLIASIGGAFVLIASAIGLYLLLSRSGSPAVIATKSTDGKNDEAKQAAPEVDNKAKQAWTITKVKSVDETVVLPDRVVTNYGVEIQVHILFDTPPADRNLQGYNIYDHKGQILGLPLEHKWEAAATVAILRFKGVGIFFNGDYSGYFLDGGGQRRELGKHPPDKTTDGKDAAKPVLPVEPPPVGGAGGFVGRSPPRKSVIPKGKIAFCSDRGGSMEIYLMEADGTAPTRLTKEGGAKPAWSPDGKKLAFERAQKGKSQIFVMDADGSNVIKLSDAEGSKPAWSPDGKHIVFEGPFALARVAATGGKAANVTKGLWNDDDPTWAPDGKQIVYSSPQAAGLEVKQVKGGIAIGGGSNRQLFAVSPDGGDLIQITPTAARQFCQPAVAPDGKQIAAVALPPGNVIDAYEDIWLLNRDGKDPRNLTNNPKAFNHGPDWSHDGKWLVFCSKRDGNFEIYAMPSTGGTGHRLTNHPSNDFAPRWRPGRDVSPKEKELGKPPVEE